MKSMRVSGWASSLLAWASAYSPAAGPGRFERKCARALRAAVLHLHADPVCKIVPAGLSRSMLMPLSTEIPSFRARYSHYDRLPSVLAQHIRGATGSLKMIDVGANIGDTIVCTDPRIGDRYLAIEPHPSFFRYLIENMRGVDGVDCIQLACGDAPGRVGFDPQQRGTASPKTSSTTQYQVDVVTLDDIWRRQWHGERVDFLKIDTDGFDVSVIRGAASLLAECHPWVYYECHVGLTPEGLSGHMDVVARLRACGYREALVFDNFGELSCLLKLEDTTEWSLLMSRQSSVGPEFYHDVLVVPPNENVARISRLFESSQQTA